MAKTVKAFVKYQEGLEERRQGKMICQVIDEGAGPDGSDLVIWSKEKDTPDYVGYSKEAGQSFLQDCDKEYKEWKALQAATAEADTAELQIEAVKILKP